MTINNQVSWNTIGQMSSLFFQWLTLLLLPMVADYSEVGIFSIGISITSIFYTIASCYLHQVQLADQYKHYSENNFLTTRITTIVIGFVLLGISLLFLDYSNKQNLVIIAYMLYRNILNFTYVFAGSIEIHNHFDYAGKACVIEGVTSFSVFFISYLLSRDLFVSTMAMALVGGASYFVTIIIGRKKFLAIPIVCKYNVDARVKELLVIGFMTLISALCPIVITALPKILLNEYSTEEMVGIFSTLTAPTIVIPTIITAMFAPFIGHYSEMARNGNIKSIRAGFCKTLFLIIGFGVIAAITSLFLAPLFFHILYGDGLTEYYTYFPLLVIGMVFYSMGMVSTNILIAKSQTRVLTITAVIALILSFIILQLSIPLDAMGGATYGLVLSYGLFGLMVSVCVLLVPLDRKNCAGIIQ